jgi:hypothetical protein
MKKLNYLFLAVILLMFVQIEARDNSRENTNEESIKARIGGGNIKALYEADPEIEKLEKKLYTYVNLFEKPTRKEAIELLQEDIEFFSAKPLSREEAEKIEREVEKDKNLSQEEKLKKLTKLGVIASGYYRSGEENCYRPANWYGGMENLKSMLRYLNSISDEEYQKYRAILFTNKDEESPSRSKTPIWHILDEKYTGHGMGSSIRFALSLYDWLVENKEYRKKVEKATSFISDDGSIKIETKEEQNWKKMTITGFLFKHPVTKDVCIYSPAYGMWMTACKVIGSPEILKELTKIAPDLVQTDVSDNRGECFFSTIYLSVTGDVGIYTKEYGDPNYFLDSDPRFYAEATGLYVIRINKINWKKDTTELIKLKSELDVQLAYAGANILRNSGEFEKAMNIYKIILPHLDKLDESKCKYRYSLTEESGIFLNLTKAKNNIKKYMSYFQKLDLNKWAKLKEEMKSIRNKIASKFWQAESLWGLIVNKNQVEEILKRQHDLFKDVISELDKAKEIFKEKNMEPLYYLWDFDMFYERASQMLRLKRK